MSIWPLSRRRRHQPLPAGYLETVERYGGLVRARYGDDQTAAGDGAGYRLQRAEIEDVDDAVWWLMDQSGEGGLVWGHQTPKAVMRTACRLMAQRYRFRREFEARKGDR